MQDSTGESSHTYRGHLVDSNNHIEKRIDLDATSDEEAGKIAASILDEQSHYSGIEVWDGSRRVCRYPPRGLETGNGQEPSREFEPRTAITEGEAKIDRFVAASHAPTALSGYREEEALNAETGDDGPAEAIYAEVAARFGILPNFFRSAGAAPGLIEELWNFALAAYLDNPLPSLFKERLFVFLSRFCPVRYCVARHVGFLVGLGRPAGDVAAPPQSVDDVVSLLGRPTPDSATFSLTLSRLLDHAASPAIPEVGTPFEADLFDALAILFLTPLASPRIREAVCRATGETNFEYLVAFLAFIRTAHYWTETHPDIALEPDVQQLMNDHAALALLLLQRVSSISR